MSYILDALKRSEQDRKQGEVPGLNSFQSQPRPPRSTSRITLYILIGALLVNALVLGIWVLSRQPEVVEVVVVTADLPETVTSTSKTTEPPVEEVESTESATMITAPPTTTVTAATPATTAPVSAESTTPPEPETAEIEAIPTTETESETDIPGDTEAAADEEETPKKLVKYRDLPANVRNDLKDLTISVHYYANDPSSRMASINGRIMRQGQAVKDGLVLDEITPKGVIFTFRKYRFSMDVFNH